MAQACFAEPILTWVIGHRGLGGHHSPEPENSAFSLRRALELGATAVELDIQLTADGKLLLAHDPRLERMTNGSGCVSEEAFADLRKLRLKDGDGKVHPDLQLSTLREALEAIRGFDSPDRPFIADIHIKVYDGMRADMSGVDNGGCLNTAWAELTDKVLATVSEFGLSERVLYTSFDRRVLNRIQAAQPKAKLGLLAAVQTSQAIRYACRRYEYVAIYEGDAKSASVDTAHECGLKYLVWSPKTLDALLNLQEAGIDGWITDDVPTAVGLSSGERFWVPIGRGADSAQE